MTRLKRRAAVLVMAAVVALGATACLPTTGADPTDPYVNMLFNAMNRDRAANGLPRLTWSPKLSVLAYDWSAEMSRSNWMRHQDLGAVDQPVGLRRHLDARGEPPGRPRRHADRSDGAGVDELTGSPGEHPLPELQHRRPGVRERSRRAPLGHRRLRRYLTTARSSFAEWLRVDPPVRQRSFRSLRAPSLRSGAAALVRSCRPPRARSATGPRPWWCRGRRQR